MILLQISNPLFAGSRYWGCLKHWEPIGDVVDEHILMVYSSAKQNLYQILWERVGDALYIYSFKGEVSLIDIYVEHI